MDCSDIVDLINALLYEKIEFYTLHYIHNL
jgi:hypothetical protein